MAAVKDRKQVNREERVAISKAIRFLLDQRDGNGKRLWTQASLGARIDLTQESIRRAIVPVGVGPAIRDGILSVLGMSSDEVVAKFGGESDLPAVYHRALGILDQRHKRDFTEFAFVVLERAAEDPTGINPETIADEIYEAANEAKGKSVVSAVEVTEADAAAPGMGGKKRRGKGEAS